MPDITLPTPRNREEYTIYENILNSTSIDSTSEDSLLLTSEGEPESYLEAINSSNSKEWLESMKAELGDLLDQNVWNLVPRPPNRQVLKGRWVYRKKTNALGEVTRFKSR